MNKFYIIIFCIFIVQPIFGASDSLRVEKEGSKTYIIHKVEPKETLFSLSRRYKVSISLMTDANPELANGLKIGQLLKIPFEPSATDQKTNTQPNSQITTVSGEKKFHIVEPLQTLYAIARLYQITVEDIKKWNNLIGNEIAVGQQLYVAAPTGTAPPELPKQLVDSLSLKPNFKLDNKGNKIHKVLPGQTLYSIAKIYKKSVDDLIRWNKLGSEELSLSQELIVEKVQDNVPPLATNVVIDPNRQDTSKPVEMVKPISTSGFNKVIERGIAEAIDETDDNPKFLALHKTAPVGTIIQVTNEMNSNYIFVRVIGKLPNTGANDKLVIKLSKRAYNKLGAVDKRFPVELSYMP